MTISNYDLWLTTPPDDGHDYHDDLDLARHNALVADMAEQDAHTFAMLAARATVTTRYVLLPFPGTELYDQCKACGSSAHNTQRCPIVRKELMKG